MPTVRYALVNAAYWAGFCLVMAFSSVFLLSRGLGNAQIGLVLSAGGLVSAGLQPWVASRVEHSRLPLRAWVAALAAAVALGAALLAVLPAHPVRDAVVFGAILCVIQVVTPLVNALGMDAARHGTDVDFGTARAVGSGTFAVTSVGVGALVALAGEAVLPPLLIATQAALVVAALTFVFRGRPRSTASTVGGAAEPPAGPLDDAGRRRFGLLLVGMTGAYASHAAINNYVFQIAEHHGGTASHLGIAFMIAAGIETLPMLFFRRLVARWSPATLLRFAAMGIAVKALATLLAPSLAAFLATMLLQVISFAVLIPASVYYVDRLMPAGARVRGQAAMTLTLTLGTVVAGLGGGVLLDAAGVPALLAAGTAAAVLGIAGVVGGTFAPRR